MNKMINQIINLFCGKKKDEINTENNAPQIVLSNDYVKKRLSTSYIAKNPVSKCLGTILSELGIRSTEKITITNCKDFSRNESGKGYYITCYKDNEYLFQLGFNFEDLPNGNSQIIVVKQMSYFDTIEKYEMRYSEINGKNKIKLDKTSSDEKYSNGMEYRRDYSAETAKYEIKNGEYILVIEIERPHDENIGKKSQENCNKYELSYEEELIRYLIQLKFPINIEEVYKKICEISLGNDISKYPFIYMYITKDGKVTDTIEIVDGEWKRFGRTKQGKTITIYPNGACEYTFDDTLIDDLMGELSVNSTIKFSMNVTSSGNISYSVSAKNESEIDDYTNTLAMYDISTARKEIENTKSLVRELIKK